MRRGTPKRKHTRTSSNGKKFSAGRRKAGAVKWYPSRKAENKSDILATERWAKRNNNKPVIVSGLPIITVSYPVYENIMNSLMDLPLHVRDKMKKVKTSDSWGYIFGGIIKTPSRKGLVVDTQGYNYPRYKGFVQ
jgi:hypothetical protein